MATTSPLRAILIPVDVRRPVEELVLKDTDPRVADMLDYRNMPASEYQKLMRLTLMSMGDDDTMPGMVHTTQLLELMGEKPSRDHIVAMLVDDDGHDRGLPINTRATVFYDGHIVGDVLLIGEDRSNPYEGYDPESLPDAVTLEVVQNYIRLHTR